VVWHFYQVFFDPDVYPMNWTWWDGKMSFEHYREEHALDSETLLQAAETEAEAENPATNSDTVPSSGNGQAVKEHEEPEVEEIGSERHS
jgi:hypothetical protein